ncbi:MAG: HD domain-containing protein [Dehalococcoidia bacterium]
MSLETAGALTWAPELAERHVGTLGDRWRHTQAVAARARDIAAVVPAADRTLLVAAAWLHDIGYGPEVRQTGFHPLDGARYLASAGADHRLCALVAHHSGAAYEAADRGMSEQLAPFEREDGPLLDALVYADMTTGPQGQRFEFDQRIEEILRRYAPGDPVHRAISAARDYICCCVQRTTARLASLPD